MLLMPILDHSGHVAACYEHYMMSLYVIICHYHCEKTLPWEDLVPPCTALAPGDGIWPQTPASDPQLQPVAFIHG
jgi:hypothetical protein